jgi:malate dehydrogenase (oxaloacetate-decarboxylating)(NADP+)
MIASMAKNPIIFAMANPDPEITPEEVADVRATPSWRRAARTIPTRSTTSWLPLHLPRRAGRPRHHHQRRDEARRRPGAGRLAREDVPDEVAPPIRATARAFGPRYIIPVPFDSAADHRHPARGREAASAAAWRAGRSRTWRPTATSSRRAATRSPARCSRSRRGCADGRSGWSFAEGEEDQVIRAAVSYASQRLGTAHPGRPRGPW